MDAAAFGDLYDRHVDQIYRFIYVRVQNEADARDLTADVFFKALKSLRQYRDEGKPFSCWLYRIAANQVTDHHRRHRTSVELDESIDRAGDGCLEDEVLQREQSRVIWNAVAELPPGQQLAMTLRFSEDLSLAAIAKVMSRSEAAVKLLIFRAVQRLRLEFAGQPAA